MELVKTIQVLVKNKVSTSLKSNACFSAGRIHYVADTPDLFPESLDKTHSIHCAVHRRKEQTPLKI